MQFGITIPNSWGFEDPKAMLDFGPLAERLGYESIWTSDHVFNAAYVGQRLGNRPYYDPLATLTYLAGTTQRVRLGTSVMVLPYHHPVNLAKTVATLDVFSGGRVDLGVGVGGIEEEFSAMGAIHSERGAVTDESIGVLLALWTQDLPEYRGKYFNFSGLPFSPKPAQKPHPPLFVGGTSRAAVRRAARVGNWWHPTALEPEELKNGMTYLRERATAQGRDPQEIQLSVRLDLDFPEISGNTPSPTRPRPCLIGTSGEMIEQLKTYQGVGVEHILVATMSTDAGVVEATYSRFAEEVIPAAGGGRSP